MLLVVFVAVVRVTASPALPPVPTSGATVAVGGCATSTWAGAVPGWLLTGFSIAATASHTRRGVVYGGGLSGCRTSLYVKHYHSKQARHQKLDIHAST